MIFENLKGVNIFEKIIIFSILLIPIALISGPAIPNILRFLIIIIGCTILLKKINLESFKNWYFFLFLLFCCYISIRSLIIFFEDGTTIEIVLFSLKSSLFYFSYLIYSLVIAYTIYNFQFIRLYLSIIIFAILRFFYYSINFYFYLNTNSNNFKSSSARLIKSFNDHNSSDNMFCNKKKIINT